MSCPTAIPNVIVSKLANVGKPLLMFYGPAKVNLVEIGVQAMGTRLQFLDLMEHIADGP